MTFFQAHYVANLVPLCMWAVLRFGFCDEGRMALELRQPGMLSAWTKEAEIGFVWAFISIQKLRNALSAEALACEVIWYAKLSVLLWSAFYDQRVLAWFCLLFSCIYLFVGPPKFAWGPAITVFAPDDVAAEEPAVVVFHAAASQLCNEMIPALNAVASASPRTRFGRIDVSKNPDTASSFKVDPWSDSKNLPVLMMVANGKEVSRLPELYKDGSAQPSSFLDRDAINQWLYEAHDAAQDKSD